MQIDFIRTISVKMKYPTNAIPTIHKYVIKSLNLKIHKTPIPINHRAPSKASGIPNTHE